MELVAWENALLQKGHRDMQENQLITFSFGIIQVQWIVGATINQEEV